MEHDQTEAEGDASVRTPLSVDLYSEVASVLTVRHLVTPIQYLKGFELDDDAKEAASLLEARGYDAAPVWRDDVPLGRVWKEALSGGGIVRDHLELISPSYVISASAPISHAMHWLASDRWLFVVEGRGFIGIVTPSDLNKQAVRTYFYLLLGELEMRLGEAVRSVLPDNETVLSLVADDRREKIEDRLRILEEGDVDSDAVAALDLADLVRIGRETESIRKMFGVESKSQWDRLTKPIPDFRHDIMHVVRPLIDDSSGLERLIRRDDRLRQLVGADERYPIPI